MKNASGRAPRGGLSIVAASIALALLGLAAACGGSTAPAAGADDATASAAPGGAPGGAPPAAAPPAPSPSEPPPAASAPPAAGPVPTASAAPPPPPPSRCPAGMVEVGGGKFKSTYYRQDMSVAPFCVDRNLVTTDEYAACVKSGSCDKSAVHACDPATWEVAGRGKMPMICIDFPQAERYCKAQGKRLLSDLEWEWAARNGEENRPFPWGADPPDAQLCWSGKEKRTTPCEVGSFPPGPHGIFDLVGNVYQWTTTTNDSVSSFRGGRGGSWKDTSPEVAKLSHRAGFKNTYRCGFLGIRCATAVP